MSEKPYPNEALTDICKQLLDDWGLNAVQIKNLGADLLGECEAIIEARSEAYWERRQQSLMESGGTDNSAYRKQLREAGRGHLLGE